MAVFAFRPMPFMYVSMVSVAALAICDSSCWYPVILSGKLIPPCILWKRRNPIAARTTTAIPAHNAPGFDPLAFGAEPGQVAGGAQFGSGCGGYGGAAVLWRTPEGAAGTGGVPGCCPAPQPSAGGDAPGSDGTAHPLWIGVGRARRTRAGRP